MILGAILIQRTAKSGRQAVNVSTSHFWLIWRPPGNRKVFIAFQEIDWFRPLFSFFFHVDPTQYMYSFHATSYASFSVHFYCNLSSVSIDRRLWAMSRHSRIRSHCNSSHNCSTRIRVISFWASIFLSVSVSLTVPSGIDRNESLRALFCPWKRRQRVCEYGWVECVRRKCLAIRFQASFPPLCSSIHVHVQYTFVAALKVTDRLRIRCRTLANVCMCEFRLCTYIIHAPEEHNSSAVWFSRKQKGVFNVATVSTLPSSFFFSRSSRSFWWRVRIQSVCVSARATMYTRMRANAASRVCECVHLYVYIDVDAFVCLWPETICTGVRVQAHASHEKKKQNTNLCIFGRISCRK